MFGHKDKEYNICHYMSIRSASHVIKFSGAGWLFPFYFGVAHQLKNYIHVSKDPDIRVGGVSAGSVVAALLLRGVDFAALLTEILLEYPTMKYDPFKIRPALEKILAKYIPPGGYDKRLVVGVCYFDFLKFLWKPEILQHSCTSCIEALKASCHIPVISGLLPCYINGIGYYDGELSEFHVSDMGPTKNAIEVGLIVKPNTINPGINLPELWKYYPHDPFVLQQLFRLGVLRTKERFGHLSIHEQKEVNYILQLLMFCMKTNTISYVNRVLITLIQKFFWPLFAFIVFSYNKKRWLKKK